MSRLGRRRSFSDSGLQRAPSSMRLVVILAGAHFVVETMYHHCRLIIRRLLVRRWQRRD